MNDEQLLHEVGVGGGTGSYGTQTEGLDTQIVQCRTSGDGFRAVAGVGFGKVPSIYGQIRALDANMNINDFMLYR